MGQYPASLLEAIWGFHITVLNRTLFVVGLFLNKVIQGRVFHTMNFLLLMSHLQSATVISNSAATPTLSVI